MRMPFVLMAVIVALATIVPASFAQDRAGYYVANTRPPDAYLALRTHPSSTQGKRVLAMPNGTELEVLNRRRDGWWYVRVPASGHEGWALSRGNGRVWIECCITGSPSAAGSPPPETPVGFRSPSGNIHCQYWKDEQGASLRCDMRAISNRLPPQPRDCDLDWGRAFEVTDKASPATRICHGDTVMNEALLVLAYGSEWWQGAFTCRSERSGVTCINGGGHGFELARASQRLF
jgi:hypothetical protein